MPPSPWPDTYPQPDEIVVASLNASNEAEEIAAITSLGVTPEDARYFGYLVANASHSIWYFQDLRGGKDFEDHPVYQAALKWCSEGYENFQSRRPSAPEGSSSPRPMLSFFHGWRRNAGVASLVMALAVTSAWLRSVTYQDTFCISRSEDSQTLLISVAQQLIVAKVSSVSARKPRLWTSKNIESSVGWLYTSGNNFQVYLAYPERGCFFARHTVKQASRNVSFTMLYCPFWAVCVPLTLLSGYLILIPSRKRLPTASQAHA